MSSPAALVTPDQVEGTEDRIVKTVAALILVQHQLNQDATGDVGFELELQLVNEQLRPLWNSNLPILDALEKLGVKGVVAELGSWQAELNLCPAPLAGKPFTALLDDAARLIEAINEVLQQLYPGARVALVGTLPTHQLSDLHMRHATKLERYPMLDKSLWGVHPRDSVTCQVHENHEPALVDSVAFMMAGTSSQGHLRLPAAVPFSIAYNTTIALAGVVAAGATNAPWWLGQEAGHDIRDILWLTATRNRAHWSVTNGYVTNDLEPFAAAANTDRFPVILARTDQEDPLAVAAEGHVPESVSFCTQVGTVWSMIVRAIFDPKRRHFRLEVRFASAGPTMRDNLATHAYLFGGILNPDLQKVYQQLPYEKAIENMEAACRSGFDARLWWPRADGELVKVDAAGLTLHLLPLVEDGLRRYGIDDAEIAEYIGIIARRAATRQSGSAWQRNTVLYLRQHGYSHEEAVAMMFDRYLRLARHGLGPACCDWPPYRLTDAA